MKQKVLALLLAVLLLLALVACGDQSSPAESPSADTLASPSADIPTEDPSDGSPAVKNEEEIIADLTASEEDFFGLFDIHCYDLDGNFDTDYTIDTLTINRRKSDVDAGTDNVYVTVVANNLATKFTGEFHLLYSLYDVGGWYLESIELETETYEPLDELTDDQILFNLNSIYYEMGADESDFTIKEKDVDETDAFVTASLDFSDGIIAVQGPIYLTYYHDGVSWVWNDFDYYDDLSYDILAEGTYRFVPNYNGSTQYLVFNHENGQVVIRFASTNKSLGGFYDDFEIQKNWVFDYASRSYEYLDSFGLTGKYCFTPEGTIDYYVDGEYIGAFTKIAEPITDINALAAHEWGNR